MSATLIKSGLTALLFTIVCQPISTANKGASSGELSNLDRAIIFAVSIEARASQLENRADVCVGFGHGLDVNEKGILASLNDARLKVHANDWCNQGPRGLVISIIGPIKESIPGTYELVIEVGDLRPVGQGEHFATLMRRGTYTVKCKDSLPPDLFRYQEAAPA